MTRPRFSLSRLLGLGHDEPPAHADEPVEDFLDPYTTGEEYRRRYLEHTTDEAAVATAAESAVEGRVAPGSRPLTGGEPR